MTDMPPLTDLSDAELAEIETRASFATGGPWTANHEFLTVCTDDTRSLVNVLLDAPDSRSHHPRASADADFIAHARSDVPRLVAALRAAREDIAVHHADEAAVSTLLAAALGDRFSPDGPLADAVGLLVGERDQARAELAKTADDMDMYAGALDRERKNNAEMDRRLNVAEAQVRSLRTYVDELIAEREEARAALARAEQATADAQATIDAADAYIKGRNELGDKTHEAVLRINADLTAVRNMLADCVAKATEYGTQDGGFVAMYLLPTGPIHRAIPYLDGVGINVRPGFDGRKALAADVPAAPDACCDLHNRNCEPPSELCCHQCTERAHESFPISHSDGSACVMDSPATADHETHPAGQETP